MNLREELVLNHIVDRDASREYKKIISVQFLSCSIDFLNRTIDKYNLMYPKFPSSYDPMHPTRWILFLLKETISNSIDAFYTMDVFDRPLEIKVSLATDTELNKVYLKIKDNGPGFSGLAKGAYLPKSPPASPKNKDRCLGGNGFGLSICDTKLNEIFYKNRKLVGASVKTNIGTLEQGSLLRAGKK